MGAKRVSKQGVTVSEGNAIEVTNTAGTVLFSVNNAGSINTIANVDAKGDLLVGSADNTLTRLAVGTNNQVLMADSATTSGLKWGASAVSTLTATGDLLYASAANTPARLAIGSTDQVLTVSGGIPAWATPSSGSMTLLNAGGTSLTGSSVVISSIPSTYQNLYIVVRNMTNTGSNGNGRLRFNGDSTANRYKNIYGFGPADDQLWNEDHLVWQRGSNNSSSNDDNISIIYIYDYASTTHYQMMQAFAISQNDATPTNINQHGSFGYYKQLGAITSLTFFPGNGNFNTGTVFVYGVK
jgi:hypothetical protein